MTRFSDGRPNVISRRIRKDIIDWLRVENVEWAGRLDEDNFLDRFVDLASLPSTDPRFETARQDFYQHRVNDLDWDDDWVYSYAPVSLVEGSDELFIAFLTEMLHPVVRPDATGARRLASEINDLLANAGVELYEASRIGARPVWAVRGRGSDGRPREFDPTVAAGAEGAINRIWGRECNLRLFLSHVSAHKAAVSTLKSHLAAYGVSAFVAHENIEPSLEWQSEIDLALATAHAVAALLTPDFHDSSWTDQEVGYAIGRGVVISQSRLPTTPFGFMGKHQGLHGDLSHPAPLARAIAEILLRRSETAELMREAMTCALEHSTSSDASNAAIRLIETKSGFTNEQLARVRRAITANSQVTHAYASENLKAYLARQQA
jgi:hypothetical protein